MSQHRLQITTPKTGSNQTASVEVILGGCDIASQLRSVNLQLGPYPRLNEATLELAIMPMQFDGMVRVNLTDEQQQLLTDLGWSPPEEPG